MDARESSQGEPRKPIVPANEARQGVSGHNVRYVLIIGTLSVIVLFGLVYAFYFAR